MSLGEREALTGFLSMSVSILLFWWRLGGQAEAGLFEGAEGLVHWARQVLILIGISIGISIGVAIAVTIVFTILYAIVTGDQKPSGLRDERDRGIELRAMRLGMWVLSFGLVAMIADLAMGGSAFRALNLVLAACALSELVKDGFKILLYRRGY